MADVGVVQMLSFAAEGELSLAIVEERRSSANTE